MTMTTPTGLFTFLFVVHAVLGVVFLVHLLACRLRAHRVPPTADPHHVPDLQVVVLTCGEAPVVLDRTLARCADLVAAGVDVVLVANGPDRDDDDDMAQTARTHGARFQRMPYLGSKARVMRRLVDACVHAFVAFVDADEAPVPGALLSLARALEAEDDDVAFVQGFNASSHRTWWQRWEVARLEIYRNVVCRARDAAGRVHFLGTTAVLRVAALRSVGIPDWSVTEDNALSALLHFSGWRSRFHPTVCSLGLPCEGLMAWWRQQRRWSHGNLTVLRWVVGQALRHPPRTRAQAALVGGYLISGSFFAASTLWSLALLGTAVAVAAGALPPMALGWHLVWLLAVALILPGPGALPTALRLVGGNLVVLPGYLAGVIRALTTRGAIFDVSLKDMGGLAPARVSGPVGPARRPGRP
jgi:cellulose synthase/poly-beta-1,6-N-acetylglucosamine synthase-like glycosyltransferase